MNQNFASARITQLERQAAQTEQRFEAFTKILKELVGKELLRSQAVQVALIKKGVLADAEIVAALAEIIDGAKSELKDEVEKREADELKKVEILVPDNKIVTPTGE
jgi:hydroxymethylpyrimidine/phosphomethylpyrimidine kinase